jgi:NAD-dependent SIR2 family protein deacetylase
MRATEVTVRSDRGHVFLAHGDLGQLACDVVLVPTDGDLDVREHWGRWVPTRTDRETIRWEDRVTSTREVDGQTIRYVNTGVDVDHWPPQISWLRDGVDQALAAAARDCLQRQPLNDRDRPLVGMPVFGTGAGGFDPQRGAALQAVIQAAYQAAGSGMDIALICNRRADYAAVQSQRPESQWNGELSTGQIHDADELGRKVRQGDVALFLGAGISRAAGLPDWAGLLAIIAAGTDLAESDDFQQALSQDPPQAATMLRQRLGHAFIDALRIQLPPGRHAIGHALLASLRVEEAITTNIDSLYEQAAATPFDGRLSVLPWGRVPGRPPWLLKMHGDLQRGSLVFTAEQFEQFQVESAPLAALVQALLVTRHLVFVGYSLRDKDFVRLAKEVAQILRESNASYLEVGTVLAMTPPDAPTQEWQSDLHTVLIGDDEEGVSAGDARALEIFLDRTAWQAAQQEASWLLDRRYEELLDPDDSALATTLQGLTVPTSSHWQALRRLLAGYGLTDDDRRQVRQPSE